MKTLVLSLIAASFALVSQAQASYFQTTCATADGKVQYTTGQFGDKIVIQRPQRVGKSGALTLRPWEHGLEVNELSSEVISSTESSSCERGQPEGVKKGEVYGGIIFITEVSEKAIEVKRKDGKAFPNWLPSLSDNGKAMTINVRCEYHYNNMIPCLAK